MPPLRLGCILLLALLAGRALAAGSEDIAIVVPAGSSHRVDELQTLAAIYRRKKQYWDDGARIEAVNLPADDPRRRQFSQRVLGELPEALDQYWNEQYFHGVLPPHVLASTEAVLRFVAATPAAIGYVPLCAADHRVTITMTIDATGAPVDKPSREACRH